MDESSPFDVFLCHNTADKPAVRQIAAKLKEMGLELWLDEDEILAGQSWLEVLAEQIGKVAAAAVFVGKDGLGRWQQEESRVLFRRSVEEGFLFIPVLLEGAVDQPELSSFFLSRYWVVELSEQPEQANLPSLESERRLAIAGRASELLESEQLMIEVLERQDIGGKLLILGTPGAGKTTSSEGGVVGTLH